MGRVNSIKNCLLDIDCHYFCGAKKIPSLVLGFQIRAWQFPTFAWQTATLSSALSGFTSEFGMGSGGSRSLWSPSKLVCRSCNQRLFNKFLRTLAFLASVSLYSLLWNSVTTCVLFCFRLRLADAKFDLSL